MYKLHPRSSPSQLRNLCCKMTIDKKLITIFGGTGNQGSAVVRSLLSHKDKVFKVRVITRDPTSAKAQAISQLGAELVMADGWDRAQTTAAFHGSWGVFINTNSDGPTGEDALEQPNAYDLDVAILDAAEAAEVEHVVYSSAGNTHRATKGRIHIAGFDCKSLAEEYARREKRFTTFIPVLPASFMECWGEESFCRVWGGFPWYSENGAGKAVLAVPPYGGDGRMPWLSLQDDFGDIVHGIFLNPTESNGKHVQAISQMIRFEDLAAEYAEATGISVQYQPLKSWRDVPDDGSHLAHESRTMFFYMNFCGGRWYAEHESDLTISREYKQRAMKAQGYAGGELTTFKTWFAREAKTRGAQGGSVTRSLLQNPEFQVRCLTRDVSSSKAEELRSLGAEVVQMDGSNEEQTQQAIIGSWGIFINNGYVLSETVRNGSYELDFGNCILRSAAAVGIQHVVFSSQPSAEELTNGAIKTPVLDVKAYGEAWGCANPVFTTFTPIMSSWYMEDFLMPSFYRGFGGFPFHPDKEGYLTFSSPLIGGREDVPWISMEDDFGDLVHGIFLNPMRWNRRTVQAVGDIVPFNQIVDIFINITGKKARFIGYEDPAEFPAFGKPELQESRDVFSFYRLREGEIFGNGITESRTAADLKRAAFEAKSKRRQGRDQLTTCTEWFARTFGSASEKS
ncbi:NmrA-like family domain-containing protein [Penicillium rolfsii]|nr:NmrA-like family domain-containing protein [Penicillium rolfsii]